MTKRNLNRIRHKDTNPRGFSQAESSSSNRANRVSKTAQIKHPRTVLLIIQPRGRFCADYLTRVELSGEAYGQIKEACKARGWTLRNFILTAIQREIRESDSVQLPKDVNAKLGLVAKAAGIKKRDALKLAIAHELPKLESRKGGAK